MSPVTAILLYLGILWGVWALWRLAQRKEDDETL
jgi:hypothetical protein